MDQIPVYDSSGKEQEKLNIDIQLSKKKESSKTFSYAIKALFKIFSIGFN